MRYLRWVLSLILIVLLAGVLVACNSTTYTTYCSKGDTEIIFTYTNQKVLSYRATNDAGILEDRDIEGDIAWMQALINTAENFGGVCTTNTEE